MPRAKLILLFLCTSFIVFLVCYLVSTKIPVVVLNYKGYFLSYIIFSFFLLLWILKETRSKNSYLFAGLIWGGALSNLTELLLNRCVNDYISFFGLFRYNFSDVCICLGILLLIRQLNKV